MKISDWPGPERPREKLLTKGAASLSDAELLAIFIQCGVYGRSAIDVGRELLARFNSIRGVIEADKDQIYTVSGLGPARYAQILAAQELGRRFLEENMRKGPPLTNPQATRDFLKSRLRPYKHEVFSCLFMDTRHRVIEYQELFFGTIDGASIYPREVVRRALKVNAAAIIFAHNHPSGVAEPSQADIQITSRLKDALMLVEIRVLDHLIVGDEAVVSMAEKGLI